MNVLVACAAPGIPLRGPSGASEHLREVARALARAGHAVRVATPRAVDARGALDPAADLDAVAVSGGRWPAGLRGLGARVDGHRLLRAATSGFAPDLVWERFDPASAAVARSGLPRVVEVDAPVAAERRWPAPPRPRELARQRRILAGAPGFAPSRWLAARLGLAHVPNGVPPLPPGVRRRAAPGPVLGFLGSGHRWHGVDFLPALLDALPGWTARVVGPPVAPAHPRLVHVPAVAPDRVPDEVAAMDVGLAPYDPAGPPWFCPLKILRYRAEGVPVVATDLGDAALLGARVLPDRDVAAWAAACRAALDAPRLPWRRTWDDVVAEVLALR